MPFKNAEIIVLDTKEGSDMMAEYSKIRKMFEDNGGVNHGHTFVCQVFAHASKLDHFFLSGTILNQHESLEFAAILSKRKSSK